VQRGTDRPLMPLDWRPVARGVAVEA
jgi:hypothetical protein